MYLKCRAVCIDFKPKLSVRRYGEVLFAEFIATVPDRGAVYIEIAGDFAMSHTTEITVEDGFFTFGQVHFADDFVRL